MKPHELARTVLPKPGAKKSKDVIPHEPCSRLLKGVVRGIAIGVTREDAGLDYSPLGSIPHIPHIVPRPSRYFWSGAIGSLIISKRRYLEGPGIDLGSSTRHSGSQENSAP